uniref:Uncharacterized protein n=1 Tax=Rhizophagus irregularis (strain DAOM 181602 / DAOM 197198 / MUCL 43194) TaxID=747089 RepID=U9T5Z3_RHIID
MTISRLFCTEKKYNKCDDFIKNHRVKLKELEGFHRANIPKTNGAIRVIRIHQMLRLMIRMRKLNFQQRTPNRISQNSMSRPYLILLKKSNGLLCLQKWSLEI